MLDGRVHLLVSVYWSDALPNRFSDAFLWRHVVFSSEIIIIYPFLIHILWVFIHFLYLCQRMTTCPPRWQLQGLAVCHGLVRSQIRARDYCMAVRILYNVI